MHRYTMFTYKKLIIFSSVSFVVIVIFGFAAYQAIFEYFVRDKISLHKTNFVRQFYLKYPIPLDFRVNFFNVTNPLEVESGHTPILKEVGPYCYDLWKERIDVVDNENEDTLTYTPHDNYVFSQERSGSLTPDDYVTILHPLIIGMINYVEAKSSKLLGAVDKALGFMFPDNKSMFLTAKVKDILFDGMFINCSSSDFAAGAVCTSLKLQVPGVKLLGKYDLAYSLLGAKNGTMPLRVTVNRGIKNNTLLGKLVAVDNITKNHIWATEDCNEFKGTDGWIYPPFSGEAEQIWIHPTDLCLNLHADFVDKGVSNSIAVRKFYSDFQQECNKCINTTTCPPQGFLDLTKCLNVPLYISLPHFLKADPKALSQVRGLKPDTEKHITRILLEEMLSLPMEAQIRLQFNFPIKPLSRISFMHNAPELIHPMLWVEIGLVMNGSFLSLIKTFHYGLTAMEVTKYLCLLGSLLGMAYGFYLYRKNRKFYSANGAIDLKSR